MLFIWFCTQCYQVLYNMPSDSPPITKRRRTSDETSPDAPDENLPVKRSSRFWFADGSVVLHAQDTQFRVHQTLLSLHSEIMKDCFSCPQPQDAEILEGCPVVHLSDSALDIENLCVLLYGIHQYVLLILVLLKYVHRCFSINEKDIELSYLTTMVRLGRKYEISYWKTSTLSYLQRLFPVSPDISHQWFSSSYFAKKMVDKNRSYLFDIINLAYENRMLWILPAAFLSMLAIHDLVCLSTLLQPCETYTYANNDIVQDEIIAVTELSKKLSPQAMQSCLRGRTMSIASFVRNIVCALEKKDSDNTGSKSYIIPTADCGSRRDCSRGLVDILGKLAKSTVNTGPIHIYHMVDEICIAMPPADQNELGVFCDSCYDRLSSVFEVSLIYL